MVNRKRSRLRPIDYDFEGERVLQVRLKAKFHLILEVVYYLIDAFLGLMIFLLLDIQEMYDLGGKFLLKIVGFARLLLFV